jgi:hypothetical protein
MPGFPLPCLELRAISPAARRARLHTAPRRRLGEEDVRQEAIFDPDAVLLLSECMRGIERDENREPERDESTIASLSAAPHQLRTYCRRTTYAPEG